ncbi:hypothetical protein HU200_026724 [Digitaria exilis]|uniref:Reverse transcriptase zinc-binding domain-containing protein n=1 Tax=Digitaria exilis TaxID=1010633 RepID=A0A835BYP2_9POAL|nr:hypothetical protein HU200_026724 [Digitaria exilis]
MRGLRRLSSSEGIHQFIHLWQQIQSVQLNNEPDQIKWRFTVDGVYSSRSAYEVQFRGSYSDYQWDKIWKLKVESKCNFFLRLLLQYKILTSDRILKRGGQANPICQLCRTTTESIPHMAANCSYSQSVWTHVEHLTGQQNLSQATPIQSMKIWWSYLMNTRTERTQLATYTIWNIWKERCRRVYDNKASTALQLAHVIQQDVAVLQLARTQQE